MLDEPSAAPRSKLLDLFTWLGVALVWALFLLAMALWEIVGWFRGYAGRRRRQRVAFLLPLLMATLLAWKLMPILWARFVLLDKAAIAARRSEGVEASQVASSLRAEALRLGLSDIQRQEGSIEVEKFEAEGSPRCRVRLGFSQDVHLSRWTWTVPIRGTVDESILPEPFHPWSDENLVR